MPFIYLSCTYSFYAFVIERPRWTTKVLVLLVVDEANAILLPAISTITILVRVVVSNYIIFAQAFFYKNFIIMTDLIIVSKKSRLNIHNNIHNKYT